MSLRVIFTTFSGLKNVLRGLLTKSYFLNEEQL